MLWTKKSEESGGEGIGQRVALQAESFYRSGKMHCAEAVLASVKKQFAPQLPDEVIRLAAGFGGGSGAGCICGAVVGATMAFGLIIEDKKTVGQMTKELHEWFKQQHRVTCCKVLTAKGKGGCVDLTASVAGHAAEMLAATKK